MKIIRMLAITVITTFSLNAQQMHYYYNGNKVCLTISKSSVNIITINELQKNTVSNFILQNFEFQHNENGQNKKLVELKFKITPNESEYANIINILKQDLGIKYVYPFFERKNAEPIGTSDIFYLKLKEVNDTTLLKKIAEQQKVQIIRQVPYMPNWYVLSVQNSVFSNSIEATNYFYETDYFENIDPAFMFDFKINCVNDSQFNQLWGLKNTLRPGVDINVCNAWNLSTGAGIKVAVVDEGIDKTHIDLANNIDVLSFNANSGNIPSVFSGNNHGTHVAGTIAAIKNDTMIVGVAPDSKIICVSYNFSQSDSASEKLASGISWA